MQYSVNYPLKKTVLNLMQKATNYLILGLHFRRDDQATTLFDTS